MTCAKLLNYPDSPWDEHEATRLRPEIAAAMPTISADLRTYTFQLRDDFAFSPPASGVVTAQSMKYTFERTLSPELASPAHQFFTNIVGEVEFNSGQANEITGIVAQGATLTFHLIEPQGEFLTLLAMPFTLRGADRPAARRTVRADSLSRSVLHLVEQHQPRTRREPESRTTTARGRNASTRSCTSSTSTKRRGTSGSCPAIWTGARFRSPTSREVRQPVRPRQPRRGARASAVLRLSPQMCIGMLPMNTSRPAAREREHAQGGQLRGQPHVVQESRRERARRRRTTSTFRRARPGFEDIQVYPRSAGPRDGARPRGLASR